MVQLHFKALNMLIVLAPIIGVLFTSVTGRWIGRVGSIMLTTGAVIVAWCMAIIHLLNTLQGELKAY